MNRKDFVNAFLSAEQNPIRVEKEKLSYSWECMQPEQIPEEGEELKLFHVCSKGKESGLLFQNDEDFKTALDITAIAAYCCGISIYAYCLMSNHVHFIVSASNLSDVAGFISRFKRSYSMHCRNKYSVSGILRRVGISIKKIDSVSYLKNCVAYLLRNPIEARAAKNADCYRWSSYACYFGQDSAQKGIAFRPLSSFSRRVLKNLLKTHADIADSGILLSEDGHVFPGSFVKTSLIEQIFDNSRENMSRYIAKVNYYAMEYELTYSDNTSIPDLKLLKVVSKLSQDWFGENINDIGEKDRIRLIGVLKRKYKATPGQIARVLSLDREMVFKIVMGH